MAKSEMAYVIANSLINNSKRKDGNRKLMWKISCKIREFEMISSEALDEQRRGLLSDAVHESSTCKR